LLATEWINALNRPCTKITSYYEKWWFVQS
jgi:hypothetical protein